MVLVLQPVYIYLVFYNCNLCKNSVPAVPLSLLHTQSIDNATFSIGTVWDREGQQGQGQSKTHTKQHRNA